MRVHTLIGRGPLLLIWYSGQCESLSEQIRMKWVYALSVPFSFLWLITTNVGKEIQKANDRLKNMYDRFLLCSDRQK